MTFKYTGAKVDCGDGFELLDQPINWERPIRVICVGAGMTGMHLVARVKQFGPGIDLQVYERQPDVGGTWYANRYPGVAVDSPSVGYTLTWAPWYNWSRFQAAGSDCLKYCNHLAEVTGVREYTRFNSTVLLCEWQEEKSMWRLELQDTKTGEKFEDEANFVVNAGGILSQPKWPEVEGREKFKGKLLHSAYWDPNVDLRGKKIALVGAGSSAIQILPKIQAEAAHVDTYIRSSTWVIPMFAHEIRDRYFGIDTSHDPLDAYVNEDPERINPWYTDEDRKMWKEKPETLTKHRKDIMTDLNSFFAQGFTIKDSEISKAFRAQVEEATNRKLVKKPELLEIFKPKWDPGCRRATPGVEYHRAIQEDNVTVVRAGVAALDETGIIDSKGEKREYDAIIFATGFNTTYAPPFQTKGRNGFSLNSEDYLKNPRGYMIAHSPNMPNYFTIGGPLIAGFNGDFMPAQEKNMDYILKFILKCQRERYKSVCVKEKCVNNLMAYADHYLKRTIHEQGCTSWYKAGKVDGRIRAIWVGSSLHSMESLKNPRWEDFDWDAIDNQDGPEQFLYLGNGMSHWDYTDDSSPYIYTVADTDAKVSTYDPNRPIDLIAFNY